MAHLARSCSFEHWAFGYLFTGGSRAPAKPFKIIYLLNERGVSPNVHSGAGRTKPVVVAEFSQWGGPFQPGLRVVRI
jgi:hypothetical protein